VNVLPSELNDRRLAQLLDYGTNAIPGLEYESTGPGKFEASVNPGLAEVIYRKSLEGWNDDETASVAWGLHISKLGRFLLLEDDQGFVTLQEFESEAAAQAELDKAAEDYAAWCDQEDDECPA
jgi:hypothetical protein